MIDASNEPAGAGEHARALGPRLKRAREAKQLTQAAAAAELRVPITVIEALERDDYARLGAPIYVRGHLRSYAGLLGLPAAVADAAVFDSPEPELRSAQRISHLRYLYDRYALRAVYLLLTAAIFVPFVWMANQRPALDPASFVRSLDAPPPAPPVTTAESTVAANEVRDGFESAMPQGAQAERSVPAVEPADFPVMASLTPFYPSRSAAPTEPAAAESGWLFRFSADSWVEVVATDGRRLEYGLVRGGSERRYAAGQIARVALGNADAVQVHRDGQPLSLDPFRRANVARFTVSSAGELLPTGG